MKITLHSLIVALLVTVSAAAAPVGKKNAGAGERGGVPPEKALAPYINHLDALLALEPLGNGPAPLRNQAPGRLAALKAQFVSARANAGDAGAAKYTAAIATCDALISAIDERQRTASQIQASAAVSGSEKINAPGHKDALNQGVRGGDLAKAVGEVEEGRREAAEKRAGHRATAKTDNSMTAMAVNRWNQRAIELRKQITDSYARISG